MGLVEQAHGLAVARLGQVVAPALPIELAQAEQEHALFGAPARTLRAPRLVGADGLRRVAKGEVNVAHGVVHLVEIILVAPVACHATQALHHAAGFVGRGEGFGLQDAGVERELVGRALLDALAERLGGLALLVEVQVHLAQEEVEAGFLLFAFFLFGCLLQQGESLGVALLAQQEVGLGEEHLAADGVVERVAPGLVEGVLGVVEPVELRVAARQPRAGLGGHEGLGGIVAGDVGKRRGRLDEVAFLELCPSHQEPGIFQEGVELLPAQIGLHLGRTPLRRIDHGLLLDGMKLYGLLTFRDGRLEVALSQVARFFVAHKKIGQHLGIVVLVALLFGQATLLVGFAAVVIDVIARDKRLPEARRSCILLRGAAREGGHGQQCQGYVYG